MAYKKFTFFIKGHVEGTSETVSLTHISLASFLWDIGQQWRPKADAADWSLSSYYYYCNYYYHIFNSCLTEMGEIIPTTTQCGGKVLFMTYFRIDWKEYQSTSNKRERDKMIKILGLYRKYISGEIDPKNFVKAISYRWIKLRPILSRRSRGVPKIFTLN